MRVVGAGSCFESRKYELPDSKAWDFICQIMTELKVKIASLDCENYIIKGEDPKDNSYTVGIKKVAEQVEVLIDVAGKKTRLFGFNNNSKNVDVFFEKFDKLVEIYEQGKICPQCKANIAKAVKFCPECGAEQ